MVEGLKAKYEQSEYCRHFLSKTNQNWLVEANPTDRFWGMGLGLRDEGIWDRKQWKGQNKLCLMLMEIRDN